VGLDKRLLCAAELVREGAVLADVGTDHGYLPIYLILSGKIKRAILSDINEGPLDSARANAASSGVSQYVELVLADGAEALVDKGATDYAILGMGGELIARIIEDAPHLKSGGISLILQPMSRPEALREKLFNSGFSVLREVYCSDSGKYYVVILARYTGERTEYSDVDLAFGKEDVFFSSTSYEMREYMKVRESRLEKIIKGKLSGDESADAEISLLAALRKRLSKL